MPRRAAERQYESAEEWWDRVSREHGPAPDRVQKVWREAVCETLEREKAARKP